MTAVRYRCRGDARGIALAAAPGDVTGIDYVEVGKGVIDVVLVKPLAGLTGDNVAITGGVRFPAPRVAPEVTTSDGLRYTVTLLPGQPTDFSTYRLAIVAGRGSAAPHPSFDPRLSAVDFSFAVDCAGAGDCAPGCRHLPQAPPPEPLFDYRIRDWEGFRRLMLDRMAVLVPGFREDDPADLTTTIIEALAYRADQQSYQLDWVGTEAFLGTARSRASITRHARLLDHVPGEGASARTFVAVSVSEDGHVLPKGTPVLPRGTAARPVVAAHDYPALLASAPVVFETLGSLALWRWRNDIALHTWGDGECTLPAGATAATLVVEGPLEPGDLLLLAETRAPGTGRAGDADPARRHVVRLTRVTEVEDVLAKDLTLADVEWDPADALPFDLVVTTRETVCAGARGNIVAADHGVSLPPPDHLRLPPSTGTALAPRLSPPLPPADGVWRPRVNGPGPIARVASHTPADPLPAGALLAVDPARCLPAVELADAFAEWEVRRDLLASGPFAREFVVETGPDGRPTLRFGDGTHGLAPAADERLTVRGRFGTGLAGNIGPGTLGHVVLADAGMPITWVGNVVPGSGGAAPDSDATIRLAAPQAFRRQERAVTAPDYAEAARRFPGVAGAVAVARWTGACQIMIVYVDRQAGAPVDRAFTTALLAHLESFRLAGFDVAVRAARTVPLDVGLSVCAAPGEHPGEVGRRVRAALSPFGDGGLPGFFHPDRFTFGTPVYLSALVAAAMAVPGVQSVTPVTFRRFGRADGGELAAGVIRPGEAELLELRDDPSLPERGRLRITARGGR